MVKIKYKPGIVTRSLMTVIIKTYNNGFFIKGGFNLMTIVSGELWQEDDMTTLFLSCCCCGKYLDKISSVEIPSYLDYVLRTDDRAFCEKCDSSQDDIIHPFVQEYCDVLTLGPKVEYYET